MFFDRRQPGTNARGRIVADLVDLQRLRLRLREGQLLRVRIRHELGVRIVHQHLGGLLPDALEFVGIVLERLRRLLHRGGENFLLFAGIGDQGLERRRETRVGAVVLDDVVDEELADHLVGETPLQFLGQIHSA